MQRNSNLCFAVWVYKSNLEIKTLVSGTDHLLNLSHGSNSYSPSITRRGLLSSLYLHMLMLHAWGCDKRDTEHVKLGGYPLLWPPIIPTTQSADKCSLVWHPSGATAVIPTMPNPLHGRPIDPTIHSPVSFTHSGLILFHSFRLQPMIWFSSDCSMSCSRSFCSKQQVTLG